MRVDLYLKLMGMTKTRMAAKRLCDGGWVRLGSHSLKPSFELQGGEVLQIQLPMREMRLKVVALPPGKSVAKADRGKFIEFLSILEIK
jgi:ribosomal 50S subunit-recycling heat shock protein